MGAGIYCSIVLQRPRALRKNTRHHHTIDACRLPFCSVWCGSTEHGRGEAVERIACIDVPQLSLQLWAREQSLEAGAPLGMVAAERAHSPLLEVNAAAWRQGVRVGMRYGAALSVCPQLRVGLMREEALEMQRQR